MPLLHIIKRHWISFHCYPDELYISTITDEISEQSKLTECVKDVKDWTTKELYSIKCRQDRSIIYCAKILCTADLTARPAIRGKLC